MHRAPAAQAGRPRGVPSLAWAGSADDFQAGWLVAAESPLARGQVNEGTESTGEARVDCEGASQLTRPHGTSRSPQLLRLTTLNGGGKKTAAVIWEHD